MLKVVAKICDEHHFTWWLSSGTLLGAARHGGFIPWDDDMDIVMLKKDYKRLEKILCNMNDDEFVFHCCKSDVDYVNIFGKFRKKKGRVQSKSRRYDYYKWAGIGFDIFFIERINGFCAFVGHLLYSRSINLTVNIKTNWIRKTLIRAIEAIHNWFIFPILRFIGLFNPKNEYHYALGTGWSKHAFFMSDTFPLTSMSFENIPMPVPRNTDAYLTNVYGDWRTPPSDEVILSTIHCDDYRNEIMKRRKQS